MRKREKKKKIKVLKDFMQKASDDRLLMLGLDLESVAGVR